MKNKIEEICNKLNREQLSVYGATEELLILFSVSNSDCKHRYCHVEEIAVVVCTDCKEILGRESDC